MTQVHIIASVSSALEPNIAPIRTVVHRGGTRHSILLLVYKLTARWSYVRCGPRNTRGREDATDLNPNDDHLHHHGRGSSVAVSTFTCILSSIANDGIRTGRSELTREALLSASRIQEGCEVPRAAHPLEGPHYPRHGCLLEYQTPAKCSL